MPPLCGGGERRSATLVTTTEAAVMVSQATTHATEPPLKAMKMMQKALASQQEQRTTAHIRADLAAGPAGSKGSDTGKVSCAPGPSTSLSRCRMLDFPMAPGLDVVTRHPQRHHRILPPDIAIPLRRGFERPALMA
jgi:hypothetical protein